MKKRILVAVAAAVAVLCLVLAGCQSATEVSLTDKDSASFKGNVFTLSLAANPTTGFDWSYEVTTLAGDAALVCTDETYKTESTSKNMGGAGGTKTWQFQASGSGTVELQLAYARSWEDIEPADTYAFEIAVENGTITSTTVK